MIEDLLMDAPNSTLIDNAIWAIDEKELAELFNEIQKKNDEIWSILSMQIVGAKVK